MSKVLPWVFVLLLVWIGLEVHQLRTGQTLADEIEAMVWRASHPLKPAEDAAPAASGVRPWWAESNQWPPASSPSR